MSGSHPWAQQVCENLGFEPDEALESYDRVNAFVAKQWLGENTQNSLELPDGSSIHRHQLIIGPDDVQWCVIGLGPEFVELAEIAPPGPDNRSVSFLDTKTLTTGEFVVREYDPQLTADGTPIWAY